MSDVDLSRSVLVVVGCAFCCIVCFRRVGVVIRGRERFVSGVGVPECIFSFPDESSMMF